MEQNLPKWKCENCGQLVTQLSYCSSCWKMVCPDCYDPYVGACKHCAQELFTGNKLLISGAENCTVEKIEETISPRHHNIMPRCKECNTPLIITPDRTKCCPHCGLVIGKGYSWIGSEPAGKDQWDGTIDNIERIIERDRW